MNLHIIVFLLVSLVQTPCAKQTDFIAAQPGGFILDVFSLVKPFDSQNEKRSLHVLQDRQRLVCPVAAPVDCGGTRCCQTGTTCCSPQGCCSTSDNCRTDGCCPKIAETCGGRLCISRGSECCGNSACAAGLKCMRSPRGAVTCCLPGMTACDNGNCKWFELVKRYVCAAFAYVYIRLLLRY